MFVEIKVVQDMLNMKVITGPKEAYDPEGKHKDVAKLFDELNKVNEETLKLRKKIDPKYKKVLNKAKEINARYVVQSEEEEEK